MSGGGGGGKKKSGFQITSVTSDYPPKEGPPAAGEDADGGGDGEGARAKEGAAPARNGPSSAPGSPGAPPASRFRVVKLDQGSGEPYKRGRWTCRDFYEAEAEQHLGGRLADSARHPHSLDSRLEVAALLPKAPGLYSPQPPRRAAHLHSQLLLPGPPAAAPAGHQARSLGGGLPLLAHPNRTPAAGPGPLRSPLALPEPRSPAPADGPAEPADWSPPGPGPEEHLLPKSVTQLIQRESEERGGQAAPRESRSRSSSPAPLLLLRDASPSRRTSDPFGAARFSLARSMFGMGAAHDSDDDSGPSSSMTAIDNKIEQAMDLVKSHLMFAVREEVEVLREQIKELSERNALLEQENALLRSWPAPSSSPASRAQLHAAKPPPSSTV
ncbi:TSC22 domain family protein 4 [Paroedura picta]|uniref:TSC22 domain family protein 4 n=1 Tax=Paroedura picta TaxID=143630 RepID=UPI004055E8E3